jgi:hypothetical protein
LHVHKSSNPTIRSRGISSELPRTERADHTVDIRAWAQMLVERGNRLFERAERERATLIGTREAPRQRISPEGETAPTRSRAGESRRPVGREAGAADKSR